MGADWVEIINSGGDFAMTGVYSGGKVILGGYGSGNIYSYSPLSTESSDNGESILSMCVFKGEVYCTTENNDFSGVHTKILKRSGSSWSEVASLAGGASYFMTVWGDAMVATTSTDVESIDCWHTTDGYNWNKIAHLGDWLWVPVAFNNELYLLGHSGLPTAGSGPAKGVKWNGSSFVDVPALCGNPLEWQCGIEHKGMLFLGGGGWTLGRGTSQATVYRYNGSNCVAVHNDPAYHEVQTLMSSALTGYLYATFGTGFKIGSGISQIWTSGDQGATWLNSGSFSIPHLYVMMETASSFVVAGGDGSSTIAYEKAVTPAAPGSTPVTPPGPTPTPTPIPPPGGPGFNFFPVHCPRCSSSDIQVIETLEFGNIVFKCNQCHAVFNLFGKLIAEPEVTIPSFPSLSAMKCPRCSSYDVYILSSDNIIWDNVRNNVIFKCNHCLAVFDQNRQLRG